MDKSETVSTRSMTQWLCVQVPWHVVSQAPQWLMSVEVSTHSEPQSVRPGEHWILHSPASHVCPCGHATPHAPQLALSVSSAAQYGAPPSPSQNVCPATHVVPQAPPEHTCCGPHATPQAPQLALSVSVVAQYAAPPSSVHSVCWPAQLDEHAPSTHTFPLPHAAPHPPQSSRSTCGSTHDWPHWIVPPPQLVAQAPL
jgi:hypothetical protein